LHIETITDPDWGQNCYLLADDSGTAAAIDPGFQAKRVLAVAQGSGLAIQVILNTHGHLDHIAGNSALVQAVSAPILIHPADAPMLTDPAANFSSAILGRPVVSPPAAGFLEDGVPVQLGALQIMPTHVPGHSPGSVCLLAVENGQPHAVFSGDALFAGSIGRTDFPGCSQKLLLRSIRTKLLTLPPHLPVYPGHGPSTTIGRERDENPFLVA